MVSWTVAVPAVVLALGSAAYLLRRTTPSTTPAPESQSVPARAPDPERLAPEQGRVIREEAAPPEAAAEEAAAEEAAPELAALDPRQRRMRQLNPKGGVPTIDVDGEVLVGFSPESMSHTLGRAVQKRLAEPPLPGGLLQTAWKSPT